MNIARAADICSRVVAWVMLVMVTVFAGSGIGLMWSRYGWGWEFLFSLTSIFYVGLFVRVLDLASPRKDGRTS